jgi:putative ABC transport system permease protein
VFRWLNQIAAITYLNLRTMRERWVSSATAVFGVAGVVAVFVAVLAIAEGLRTTLTEAGQDNVAIVLRGGSDTEMTSILAREDTRIMMDAAGIRQGPNGPLASAELMVLVDLPKRSTGTDANVPLRGIQPAAYEIRDRITLVQGRRFQPGRTEVIVGRGAMSQFAGLDFGSTLRLGENEWTIVGVFTSEGTVAESEIWADASVVQSAYRRGTTFQSLYARLESPDSFDAFKDTLTTDPRLDTKVMRESEYYAGQSTRLIDLVRVLGLIAAGLMGIGAVFGALNTMYTAVSARTREIATLRALGFGASPVVVSVLAESLLLALAGGLVGGGLAYLFFDGFQTSTMNWQTFSQVAFAFNVTPVLLVLGILYSLAMGLIGGFLPAIRAARLPVAAALREL